MCESLLGFNWLKKYLSIFFCYFVALYDTVFFQSTLVSWLSKSITCKYIIDKKTEKLIIVTLQFQGYDENAEIDDWEDANFFVYKITDRYGFLQ